MIAIPLSLRRENGKRITCEFNGKSVALIVWCKNGEPRLPLDLTISEATGLRTLLDAAIARSVAAITADQFMSATSAQRNRMLKAGALKGPEAKAAKEKM